MFCGCSLQSTWCIFSVKFDRAEVIIERNMLSGNVRSNKNSEKLYELDCLLGSCSAVRYSRNCPPDTEPNAVYRFHSRPFLDPFLAWRTQPTFTHPTSILPFWYLGSGFFHSHIRLQLRVDFWAPLCVRELCLILHPFGNIRFQTVLCHEDGNSVYEYFLGWWYSHTRYGIMGFL
jgi:hypothetical protein